MAATDLSTEIADNAQGLAEARGDSGSARKHPIRDQIEADRYLAGKDALEPDNLSVGFQWAKMRAAGGC